MKRTGILILLLFLCGALLLTYFIILNNSSAKQSETTSEADTETLAPIEQLEQTKISKIEYTKDGETLSFVYDSKNAVWKLESDSKCPLNQELVSAMATALSAVEITQKLDGTADNTSSEYGLDAPAIIISRTDSDGSKKTFSLGNYNGYNQSYYMSVTGDGAVYMTSASFKSAFDYSLYGLVVSDTSEAIPSDKITSLDISRGDLNVNTADSSVISAAASVALSGCVDYYAEDDELAGYGFDSQVKIVINYNDEKTISSSGNSYSSSTAVKVPKVFEYYLGSACGNDAFYIMMQGSRMVFKISKSTADVLTSVLEKPADDAGNDGSDTQTDATQTGAAQADATDTEIPETDAAEAEAAEN